MKRRFSKVISIVLLVTIVACSVIVPIGSSSPAQVTGSDLDDARNKSKEIAENKKKKQQEIDEIVKNAENLEGMIQEIDKKVSALELDLYDLREKITDKEEEIAENEEQLSQAEQDRDEQYEAMKLRIQFMYEHNPQTYLSLLLGAQNMGDMLNKVEYITKISDYDREMLEKLKETIELIEATKQQLETDYASLKQMQDNLEIELAGLEVMQQEKNNQLEQLYASKKLAEEALADIEDDEKASAQLIAKLEEEERKKAEQGGPSISYDGGMFAWPTVSTRITSNYGDGQDRNAPHQGIDIGALVRGVSGDPVYAAYDGVVEVTAYSITGGNYIIINHGNGLRTRYFHLSAIGVSKGQTVSKGETIGKMGTTGTASTGVHLHFDVWQSGTNVSPWNYLK